MAWCGNPNSYWGKLDNISRMSCNFSLTFTFAPKQIKAKWSYDYDLSLGEYVLLLQPRQMLNFELVSAVQNSSLHASNGCYYTLCAISFQIYLWSSRVRSVTFLSCIYISFPLTRHLAYVSGFVSKFVLKQKCDGQVRKKDGRHAPNSSWNKISSIGCWFASHKTPYFRNFHSEPPAVSSAWICEC